MYSLNEEIEKRMRSNSWSKEIAEKVIFGRARRAKRNLTLSGSLFAVFFLFFVIGFNFTKTKSEETSWNNYIMSRVIESTNTAVPEDIVKFISYSF
jgi:hypothetical protein